MDIKNADKMKVEFRIMLWYLRRHLKKNYKVTFEQIENDLENCGNPAISELWDIIKNAANNIKEDYQKDIVLEFPMALLWIVYRDTAYLPISMYILKQVFNNEESILPAVNKYYKDPEDWYVNAWHDSKKHTQDLKDEGKIPNLEGMQGMDEKIFTPSYQHDAIQPLIKNIEKETELKRKSKNYGREENK